MFDVVDRRSKQTLEQSHKQYRFQYRAISYIGSRRILAIVLPLEYYVVLYLYVLLLHGSRDHYYFEVLNTTAVIVYIR